MVIQVKASCTALALFLLACTQSSAQIDDPAFYKGKQITMIIGGGVGGGFDVYARAAAQFMPKYIPGSPPIVSKNLPAGFGIAAANALNNTAERDGLIFAAFTQAAAFEPLLGTPNAKYEPEKFGWLGSMGKLQNVCATWYENDAKTLDDLRRKEVMVGASGATGDTALLPNILNEMLGTKLKVVNGYAPGMGIVMAVERGEIAGVCGLAWSTIKASKPDWVRDKKLNVILQLGLSPVTELPDVPMAIDSVKDATDKAVLHLILVRQEMGRPFAAPPGIPPQRLRVMQSAFEQTMKDPEFLAYAEKLQLEIDLLTGDQVRELIEQAYASPAEVVQKARRLLQPVQ